MRLSEIRFQCNNNNCREKKVNKKIFVWSDREENPFCKECGVEMEEVKEILRESGPALLKFSSMNPDQKRILLKKRSQDHFYKSGLNEKRNEMLTKGND